MEVEDLLLAVWNLPITRTALCLLDFPGQYFLSYRRQIAIQFYTFLCPFYCLPDSGMLNAIVTLVLPNILPR